MILADSIDFETTDPTLHEIEIGIRGVVRSGREEKYLKGRPKE